MSDSRSPSKLARRHFIQSSAGALLAGASFKTVADCGGSSRTVDARERAVEAIIEPSLPIVDPHHHLWVIPESTVTALLDSEGQFERGLGRVARTHGRYLLDDFLADATSGHNVQASVFLEAGAMYRATGPVEMRSVGEVEFANGVAAMGASELFGKVQVCAGIVGYADLNIGDAVEEVLLAHVRAGNGRYRGVRNSTCYDPDPRILGGGQAHTLLDKQFRAGFRQLGKLGLSFDAYLLEPQLPELIDLANTFPDTQIILDHLGTPVGIGAYAGKRDERFPIWRNHIRAAAKCGNIVIKLGGLATALPGFASWMSNPSFTSEQLAAEWKPYIETAIDAFGVHRCMFESDFPVASATASYVVIWNTFKRIAAGASHSEKAELFSGTARRVYRLAT